MKLLLCVVRAYDVPVRQDVDPLTTREGPRESQVAPFLEATFQVSLLPRYYHPALFQGNHFEDRNGVRIKPSLESTAGVDLQATKQ